MDNFILGLQAIFREAGQTLLHLGSYPLLWGFAAGFFTSAIVHAFLLTQHPRQIGSVLFEDKARSFQRLYPPGKDGCFTKSYVEYSRVVDRTKISFLAGFLAVTILLLIVTLTR